MPFEVMLKMKKLLIFGILCLMALPINAQRCAVLDFQIGTGVTEEEIDGLTYNFRANFSVDGFRIIPKEPMYNAIAQLGFNRTDMTQQQVIKLGRYLEAKLIVVGTMNKFMDEYSVDIRALDVASGITCASEGITFEKRDYRQKMEQLAARLGEKLASLTDSGTSVSSSSRSSQSSTSTGYSKPATSGSINGHDWVDLGLSVKWATCNVGASLPSLYGNYYAWGETSTKGDYSSRMYNNPSYDTASANWGGTWRMPTDDEWTELRTKCTWTWTTQNGVYGRKVTGPNGNSIFLPAAGGRNGTSLYDAGSYGYYWSSSLYESLSDSARGVYFGSGGVNRGIDDRYYGLSVRPVQ